MTWGAILLAVVVGCVVAGLGIAAVGQAKRRLGEVERRQGVRIDALEAEVTMLATRVADLAAGFHELSESQRAIALSDSDKSGGEVPVITKVPEPDHVDLSGSRVASVTLAAPLIKVAALSHGVRRALDEERRMRISYAMRKELRRQRKMRRRRRGQQGPSKGWVR